MMTTQTIERFTARVAKAGDGPLDDVGHSAQADSATMWALLHDSKALSASVVRIRFVARPSVDGLLFLRHIHEMAD